jgi:hypothetical protein
VGKELNLPEKPGGLLWLVETIMSIFFQSILDVIKNITEKISAKLRVLHRNP